MHHFAEIMRVLRRRYPGKAASAKGTPWESLLFTALSARTRDDQTEIAFRRLMAAYPSIKALAAAAPEDVEQHLRTIGLYRTKSRQAVAMAKAVVENFGGRVPKTIEELVTLPAVGRKTASCVLVYAYGMAAIPVDTHVHRIANRLGWVKTATPEKTESALRVVLPKAYWKDVNRLLVFFGRDECHPGVPRCWECPVAGWCGYKKKTPPPK